MNDARKNKRHICRGAALIQPLPVEYSPIGARIKDISEGGCLMELPPNGPGELSIDEILELFFGANDGTFRARARVRVFRPGNLVGFEFLDMSTRRIKQLRAFIDELALEEECSCQRLSAAEPAACSSPLP